MRMSNHLCGLSRMLTATLAAGTIAVPPSLSLAAELPPEALGTWARNCADAKSPRVSISDNAVTITSGSKRLRYIGVDVSYTFYGGSKATGENAWVLVSKTPGQAFEFVVEVAMTSRKRGIRLEEGNPDNGREVRPLFGKRFVRCSKST